MLVGHDVAEWKRLQEWKRKEGLPWEPILWIPIFPLTIEVSITPQDIAHGKRYDAENGPTTLSFRRAILPHLEKDEDVEECYTNSRRWFITTTYRQFTATDMDLPRDLQRFDRSFDKGEKTEPGTYSITMKETIRSHARETPWDWPKPPNN